MATASNQAELPISGQEATAPTPESMPEEERETAAGVSDSKYVGRTLASLVLAGVGASAWVLYFTDWFPLFLSLLTLGGAFAWISFVAGMLTEDRKKDLQHRFEKGFLAHPRAWLCILVVTLGGLLMVTVPGGTVIVETYGDQEHRAITFAPLDVEDFFKSLLTQRRSLSPHGSHKFYVWHLGFHRSFSLDISRLPSERLEVGFFRQRVIVPNDLNQQPVVLIRPTFDLSDYAQEIPPDSPDALFLCVERNGEALAKGEPFRGKAVWLGAGADMTVPRELETRWKDELRKGHYGEAMLWLPASGNRQALLNRGDRLLVKLVQRGGGNCDQESAFTENAHTVGEDHLIEEVKLERPELPD